MRVKVVLCLLLFLNLPVYTYTHIEHCFTVWQPGDCFTLGWFTCTWPLDSV